MSERPAPPPIWLIFVMIYTGQLASMIYLPGVPDIARDFGASLSSAQSLVGAYLIVFALTQLVMGPLADRFGRRPVIVGGLIVFTVASGACVLVPDMETFYVLRALQATGACATVVVGRSVVRDTTEGVETARLMAWVASAIALGPATAPFLGGLLTGWFGWQSTFIATALIGVAVLSFVVVYLQETLPAGERRPAPVGQLAVNYLRLAANRKLTGYTSIIAFASGAMSAFITATPVVLVVLMGVSPEMYGAFLVIMPVVFMVANQVARLLTYRISVDAIILIGAAFSMTGGVAQLTLGFIGIATPTPLLLAFAISQFGTGMVSANCYAQALSTVAPPTAGQASALSGCMHIGWTALVSFAVAQMHHTSSLQFGIAQATTTTLAAAAALVVIVVAPRAFGFRPGPPDAGTTRKQS